MKIVTPAQMAAIDRATIEDKRIPGLLLMEHAGLKILEAIRRELPDYLAHKFLVVAGTGNNAGDGFVLARNLARAGAVVGVELVRGDEGVRGDAKTNLDSLAAYDIEVFHALPGHPLRTLLTGASVVVDAMLGTGARGELASDYREAVENVVQSGRHTIAIDVPTGLDAATGQIQGPAVRADFTVTMGLPKLGFFQYPAPDYTGKLYVAEIGFPPPLLADASLGVELSMAHELAPHYPGRRADSHKHDHGRVLVLGGSRGMAGAAVLAARAALRGGAGLVRLLVPRSQQAAAASMTPEVMVSGAAEDEATGTFSHDALGAFREMSEWATVVVLGPGLGRGPAVQALVRDYLESAQRPTVIDADGLHALQPRTPLPQGDFLMTPHAGELSHLMGVPSAEIRSRRTELAVETARVLGAAIVVKGPYSLVASPVGRLAINPTGNAGLATGGSGDVLAGLIAAMRTVTQISSFDALRLACYLHGLAGDLVREAKGGPAVLASDLLEELPRAFEVLRHAQGPIAYDKVRVV